MSSFQDIIQQHNKIVTTKQQKVDAANTHLAQSIEAVTATTLVDITAVSKKVYNTQKTIEQKSLQLNTETQKILAQTQQWTESLHELTDALKHLGDINNWCYTIESDMQYIAKALDNVIIESSPTVTPDKK